MCQPKNLTNSYWCRTTSDRDRDVCPVSTYCDVSAHRQRLEDRQLAESQSQEVLDRFLHNYIFHSSYYQVSWRGRIIALMSSTYRFSTTTILTSATGDKCREHTGVRQRGIWPSNGLGAAAEVDRSWNSADWMWTSLTMAGLENRLVLKNKYIFEMNWTCNNIRDLISK